MLLVEACLASCVTHHDEVVRIQSATLLRRAALAEADPWHKVWLQILGESELNEQNDKTPMPYVAGK